MLSREDARWLINTLDLVAGRASLSQTDLATLKRLSVEAEKPLELLVICPRCFKQHVDEGHFAVEPHKNHSCQFCGLTFQVAGQHESIGVQFFSGYRSSTYTLTPVGTPTITLPITQPPNMPITVLHPGTKVQFDLGSLDVKEKGYDCVRVFSVAELRLTPDGTEVRLEGDNPPVFYPLDYFILVK